MMVSRDCFLERILHYSMCIDLHHMVGKVTHALLCAGESTWRPESSACVWDMFERRQNGYFENMRDSEAVGFSIYDIVL